jgi:quinol monooxygenase YgiN
MITITAVIRVKKGCEQAMQEQLLAVAENVKHNEPGTVGFYISQDLQDAAVFTTYERFLDQAAMDLHNGSATVAKFFAAAKPMLEGDVVLVTSREVSAKP